MNSVHFNQLKHRLISRESVSPSSSFHHSGTLGVYRARPWTSEHMIAMSSSATKRWDTPINYPSLRYCNLPTWRLSTKNPVARPEAVTSNLDQHSIDEIRSLRLHKTRRLQ